jgi:uncharacterized protein Yka (UPF0111/DUF47 family)
MSRTKKRGAIGVLRRLFPEAPDFLSMLSEQCDVLVEAHAALASQMSRDESGHDIDLMEAISRGSEAHRRTLDHLNRAFVTPIDREDISLASERLAQVSEYIESTSREMELLGVPADAQIQRMVATLGDGIDALRQGFASLGDQMLDAESEAQRALASERRMEELYRAALSDLFRDRRIEDSRGHESEASPAEYFRVVVKILKRREVYRHLSNAADRVASAGEALHSIVVKWT